MQADDPGAVEVLEAGGRPPMSPRTRRVLLAALAAACLLGGVVWLFDAQTRGGDERAVAACRDAAVAADTRASTTVGFMVRHIEPALFVVPPGHRRAGLVALVADAAARALPQVRDALELCRHIGVRWLHRDLAGQLAAYVDYLDARVRRLEEVAADGGAYYKDQPRLAELRTAAFGT